MTYKKSKATLDFDTLYRLRPGFFASASRLNPPSGHDCTHILRRNDMSLGWCDSYGEQIIDRNYNTSTFTDKELKEEN